MVNDLERVRELLVEQLSDVEAEQHARTEAATPSGERPGFGKRAGDYVAQVVEDRTNHQLADQLAGTASMIRAALEAMDRGDYGRCEVCWGEIGAGRLEALPWTRVCITCKTQAESRTVPAAGRSRFGSTT